MTPIAGGGSGIVDNRTKLYRETFEIVWSTVKNKHYDPKLGGLDWDRVREQYASRLNQIKSDGELHAMLQQMLDELKQSHFSIMAPDTVIDDHAKAYEGGGIGADFQIIDSRALVTRLDPDSPAARAGLRTGFVITQIDDTPFVKISSSIRQKLVKRKEPASMIDFVLGEILSARTKGKPGTIVTIKCLDGSNKLRIVKIKREQESGEFSQAFGNFPAMHTVFEARRLADGIGYIHFNIWVMNQMEKLRAAVKEMKDAPGIIFDLRGNTGGLGAMASGLAGVLEQHQVSLGTMQLRAGHQNFVAFPQPNSYTGPIVILTDYGSMSTSEIFAAGMQETGRAIVVGERTAGAALPSYFEKLPTGAIFQYAIGDFKTPKGVLVEGRGVIPDISAKHTRAALLKGRDTMLDASIKEIYKRIAPK